MSPKDQTVTEVGGQEMSSGDMSKLQAAYGCDGTTYSGCGGYRTGQEGNLSIKGEQSCHWLITVDPGFVVELEIKNFSVRYR